MKRNLIISVCILLLGMLFFPGCQKSIKDEPLITSENELQSRGYHGDGKDGCRLIRMTNEYGEETLTYNKKGLLDEWYISFYNGYFKQEYDVKRRLIKSRFYSDGTLVNTIKFSYRDNKVVRETWYTGDTREKWDEVFYYYNRKGQVTKNISIIQDYTNSFEYTAEGNVLKWSISFGGKPYYSSEFTYLRRQKNPFSAIPGVDNGFPFANGAFYANKWYSTSEKDVLYDEQGNAIVEADQDPYKTMVRTNSNNYVTVSDFYDKLTQEYNIHFRFEYENCGYDDPDRPGAAQKMAPVGDRRIGAIKRLRKSSGKSMKEQVMEMKRQLVK